MKTRIFASLGACVLMSVAALPAYAQQSLSRAMTVPSCGVQGFPLGTVVNPVFEPLTMLANGNLCTNGASSGGGGSAADQTGTNATDGQATSTNNQHALSFGYIFNGTTWDRIRGTGGAVNTTDQNAAQTITTPGTAPSKAQGIQGVPGGIALQVSAPPVAGACTDTVRTLTAGTSTTLLSPGTYKSVDFMDVGTNPATFTEGTAAAVVGNGMALSGAQAAGYQGGSYHYSTPPTNAVQGISTAGTTVIVKVCN